MHVSLWGVCAIDLFLSFPLGLWHVVLICKFKYSIASGKCLLLYIYMFFFLRYSSKLPIVCCIPLVCVCVIEPSEGSQFPKMLLLLAQLLFLEGARSWFSIVFSCLIIHLLNGSFQWWVVSGDRWGHPWCPWDSNDFRGVQSSATLPPAPRYLGSHARHLPFAYVSSVSYFHPQNSSGRQRALCSEGCGRGPGAQPREAGSGLVP